MDAELLVERRARVLVELSREELAAAVGPTGATGTSGKVDAAKKLVVEVIPRVNLDVVGEDRVEVDVPAPDEPVNLLFEVRPPAEGPAEVWVVVRQGPLPLATLTLRPVVVTTRAAAGALRAAGTARPDGDADGPLNRFAITERPDGEAVFYRYELELPAARVWTVAESARITGDRGAYVRDLYARLEKAWTDGRDKAAFAQQLRAYGAQLFDQLFPKDFQRLLWKHRDDLDAPLVVSSEPFVPWELVHLKDPDARGMPPGTHFLGQTGLTRWMLDPEIGEPPPRTLRVRTGRARFVVPDYTDPNWVLPDAAHERDHLAGLFGATAVPPVADTLRSLLAEPGAFDLLHFACHGEAEHDAPAEARLLLETRTPGDRRSFAYLGLSEVEQFANLVGPDDARPVVVVNACQTGRGGTLLTSLGGFAQAFLRAGAGAFVAALWSVGDAEASTFIRSFYDALAAGEPLGEATRKARAEAQAFGDATWLAYVVYGHPDARLTRT